jgi:hypothetical protein
MHNQIMEKRKTNRHTQKNEHQTAKNVLADAFTGFRVPQLDVPIETGGQKRAPIMTELNIFDRHAMPQV